MKSFTAASVATTMFMSTVGAQQQYSINPNSVSNVTRDFWCQQQTTQCPLICLDQGSDTGTTSSNECDPSSLTYSCVCDNGLSPNVSEYSNTLPFSICTEWGTQCVANCRSDTECASRCRQDHPCGALNPTRQNTSTLTSTRTSGASAGTSTGGSGAATTDADGVAVYTGFANSGASSTGAANGGDNNGGSDNNNNNNNGGGAESSASTHVRVWALSAGQTFGTLGLMGAAALSFAVLL